MTSQQPAFEEFHDDAFLREVFNAIPGYVFIVDQDVKLLFWNTQAQQLSGEVAERLYIKRGGEAIHCIHSFENPGGCGASAACGTCPIRSSVASSFRDKKTCRAFARVEICSGDAINEIFLLSTASPFTYRDRAYALLILEDVSHVIALDEARSRQAGGPADKDSEGLLAGKEREILIWLKKGKSSWDIAQILKMSERTVNYHIYNIIQKLDAMNRTHAVAIALEKGLLQPSDS